MWRGIAHGRGFSLWPSPKRDSEARQSYVALEEKNRAKVQFYYTHLSVVDSKASVLLRVNAIYIAVISFIFSGIHKDNGTTSEFPHWFILAGLAALLLTFTSTALGLSVVRLHWFNLADMDRIDTNDVKIIDRKIGIIDFRTRIYRLAWIISLVSIFVVGAMLFNRIAILL
jgi:hypothetical protein